MLNGRIICGMATMPSRHTTARRALQQLSPQVDQIFLYLDRFDEIPDYAQLPNVTVLRSQEWGEVGAAGKLLGQLQASDEDFYLFADDDIDYPEDFAERVVQALSGRHRNSVVGFHGCTLRSPLESYLRDREVIELRKRLWFSRAVDVVATCAGGYRCDKLRIDVRTWPHHNMVDLQLALAARKAGQNAHLLSRRKDWIRFSARNQADSIFASLQKDDSVQTGLARELLELSAR